MRSFVTALLSICSLWESSVVGSSILAAFGRHSEPSKSSITEIESLMHQVPLLDGLSPAGEAIGPIVLKHIHNMVGTTKEVDDSPLIVGQKFETLLSNGGIKTTDWLGRPVYYSLDEAMGMLSRVSDAATQGSWEGLFGVSRLIQSCFLYVDKSRTGFESQQERVELFEKLAFLRSHYLTKVISKEEYERELAAIENAMNERLRIAQAAAAELKAVEKDVPSRRSSGGSSTGTAASGGSGYASDASDPSDVIPLLPSLKHLKKE